MHNWGRVPVVHFTQRGTGDCSLFLYAKNVGI